ncbi:MAG: O-antigen ligase family protein [Terriglobia bacterium]
MTATLTATEPRRRERFGGLFFWILLFFFDYYAFPVAWVPGLHLAHPGKLVGIGVIVALLLNINSFAEALLPDVMLILLLVVQMGLASIFSPVWKGGAIHATETFSQVVLIVFAMALAVRTGDRLRKLVFVQTASAAAIGILSLVSGVHRGGRLTAALAKSNYSNANDLALALVLTVPFCFYFFFRSRGPLRKAIWAIAMLAMSYTVLLTASRGGFIALAVAAGICLWEYGIKARRLALILAAALAAVAIFAVAGTKMQDRLSGTLSASSDYEASHASYEARKAVLITSLRVTAEYPLFGVGPGDFPSISGVWNQTHNLYTTLSAEAGLPALVIFLLMYRRAFADLREARRRMPDSDLSNLAGSLRASLLAFALAGLFFPDAYMFFPYLMLALATAILQTARNQDAEIQAPELVHGPARAYGFRTVSRSAVPAR